MKKIHNITWALTLSLLLTGSAWATGAAISINPRKVTFNPKVSQKRSQYITVTNVGKKTAYVLMNVFDMQKPINEQTQKSTLKRSFGLIALPRKMAIKPGHSKRVTLTNLLKNIPTERDFELQFKLVKKKALEQAAAKTSSVGIKVEIQTIKYVHVFVLPKNQVDEFTHAWNTQKHTVEFKNTGTMSIKLSQGSQCIGEKCTPFPNIYLPPNTSRFAKLPSQETSNVTMAAQTATTRLNNIEVKVP